MHAQGASNQFYPFLLFACLSTNTQIARSGDINELQVLQLCRSTYLHVLLLGIKMATRATKYVFYQPHLLTSPSIVMPCAVSTIACILKLNVGMDCQVHKLEWHN